MATRLWGSERLANTSTLGPQIEPAVTALEGGGFVIAWTDTGTLEHRVRYQIFDETGRRIGFEATPSLSGDQNNPTLAPLANGTFWLVQRDNDALGDYDIEGGIYRPAGSVERSQSVELNSGIIALGEPEVSANNVASVAVWTDPSVNGGDVRVRFFTPAGTPYFSTTVNTNAGSLAAAQVAPSVAIGGVASAVVVVWQDQGLGGGDIRARVFNSNGTDSLTEFAVSTNAAGLQAAPKVAFINSDHFVVVWTESNTALGPDTQGTSIRGRIFDDLTGAVGPDFQINSTSLNSQSKPVVVGLPGGGFVVAWEDLSFTPPDTTSAGIRLQAFDGGGARIGGEILVNTSTFGIQLDPAITALEDGRVVVTWRDDSGQGGDTSDYGIKFQIVDPRDGLVHGTTGDETLYGHNSIGDEIRAGLGDDVAYGLAGNDTIIGGLGLDRLIGGLGDDTIDGGNDADIMAGGNATGSWAQLGAVQRIGDFNGDFRADIAEVSTGGRFDVWRSGSTQLMDNRLWASAIGQDVLIGDFNGDNRDDLFQRPVSDNAPARVYLSDGVDFPFVENWGSGFAAAADGSSQITRVADFNADGRDDVLQMTAAGTAYVWTSTGTGFNTYAQWGSGGNLGIRIADFNGDNRADLFKYPGTDGGQAQVALSTGTGFGAFTNWGGGFAAAQDGPGGITRIGNVGGPNTFADVVQISASGGIYVWTANAGGTGFNAYANWGSGATLKTFFADMNGDGRMDLLKLPSLDGGQAQVALSTGSGYTAFANWGGGMWAESSEGGAGRTQVADFNGDAKADILQLSTNGRAYMWLTNGIGNAATAYTVWGTGQTKGDSAGNDTFVFTDTNFGKDLITDFAAGAGIGDVIELNQVTWLSYENVLSRTADVAGSAVITLDANNSITLLGVTKAQLVEDDFRFI